MCWSVVVLSFMIHGLGEVANGLVAAACGAYICTGHWAACCKRGAERNKGGRVRGGGACGGKQRRSNHDKCDLESGNREVNQVEYDGGEEPFAFPINFNGERACVIM